jgi:hypothetical protein
VPDGSDSLAGSRRQRAANVALERALRDNVPSVFRQSPEDAKAWNAAVAASLLPIVQMLAGRCVA